MTWNARLYQLLNPDKDVQKCLKEASSMREFLDKLKAIGKLKEYLKYVKVEKYAENHSITHSFYRDIK